MWGHISRHRSGMRHGYIGGALLLLLLLLSSTTGQDPEGVESDEDQDEDPELAYNRTYQEHQTKLEQDIFKGYTRTRRPVRNESDVTVINIHMHIIHLSVNQLEQTMTVHGHIYMTWKDEFLGWDAAEYNGIRMTRCNKWQIWQPLLKVANSVSGVHSNFEINRQAHVLLQSNQKEFAKVEVYPTFSIKVGCSLDYAEFPFDSHRCTIRLFLPDRMNTVQLQVYYDMPPTVMFGWGDHANKKVISDFEVYNITNNVTYYSGGNFTEEEPITAGEQSETWSILNTHVFFRRHSVLFGVGLALPCLVSAALSLLPAFMHSIEQAVFVLVANMFLQAIFVQDLIYELPLVVSRLPSALHFYSLCVLLNVFSTCVHLWCASVSVRPTAPPPFLHSLTLWCKHKSPQWAKKNTDSDNAPSWQSSVACLRVVFALSLALIYALAAIKCFII